jgi:hypothetical protein
VGRANIENSRFWASAATGRCAPGAEEVTIMGPMFRPCQDCGGEQLFEQPHSMPGSCPDAPDGLCPEWSCTQCGAALIVMVLPRPSRPAALADVVGQVA